MAGAGYKDFTAGDVLTAAQVDTYLMEQSVMVFASASARDTALSAAKAEGMHAYLSDAPNRVTYYDGAAWNTVWSEWASFTPTWTNLTVGNATQAGEYRYVPGGLWARGNLTFGSTTSVSGVVSITIPNSESIRATATSTKAPLGTVVSTDSSPAADYSGIVMYATSTTVYCKTGKADGTYLEQANWSASVPFTWATGDGIAFDFLVPL